jgi:predicted transcriptional regulator
MPVPTLPRLSDAEFEIMGVIWDEGEATVNRVWTVINRRRPAPLSRTTIQVQMNRLEEKKWLKHRTNGRTFLYSTTRRRDKTLESLVGDMYLRFFKGSCADFMQCLFKSVKISKDEIQKLREIIDSQGGNNT